jgi:branched-chain amino acid transport system substrate-binding protein
VQRAGTDAADDVVSKLEGYQYDDMFARNATIRAQDHRVVHAVSLPELNPKSEVTTDWYYAMTLRTIPAAEAFRPAAAGGCSLS